MIYVLKNGNRVWYAENLMKDTKLDKTVKYKGELLCVIKYDYNFEYSFCINDIQDYYP
jgi:hypothetical protein